MNTTNAQHLPSIEEFKQQARELKKSQNFEKLGHAQNALAKEYGYKDYRAIKSTLKSDNVQNNDILICQHFIGQKKINLTNHF